MTSIQLREELQKRMTPELAIFIAANFEVASAINTPDWPGLGSGFDATVWRGRAGTEFAGQVFVSTRGTEPPLIDIWGADVDLAVNVAARSQIIDMVNWWLRETAPEGLPVKQLLETTEIITEVDPLTNLPTERVVSGMRLVDGAVGTGHLVGTTSVQVNGHSLGGHLASAFARITWWPQARMWSCGRTTCASR